MKFSPSNNHDRECLMAVTGRVPLDAVHDSMFNPAHAAQDDMGEWAAMNAEGLRLGLADARLQQLADEERAKVLSEALSHFPRCSGLSCGQGRRKCRENCAPAFAEMGCATSGEPPVPVRSMRSYPAHPRLSVWRRLVLAWTRLCAGFRRA